MSFPKRSWAEHAGPEDAATYLGDNRYIFGEVLHHIQLFHVPNKRAAGQRTNYVLKVDHLHLVQRLGGRRVWVSIRDDVG